MGWSSSRHWRDLRYGLVGTEAGAVMFASIHLDLSFPFGQAREEATWMRCGADCSCNPECCNMTEAANLS